MNTIVGQQAPGASINAFKRDEKTGLLQADLKAGGVDLAVIEESVKAATEARLELPTKNKDKATNQKEALATIQLSAMKLQESLEALQGKSLIDSKRGVFGLLEASYTNINGNPGSQYFVALADKMAEPRTADISVTKLAERDTQKAPEKFADTTSASGIEGTLTFKNITKTKDSNGDDVVYPDVVMTLDGTESPAKIVSMVNAHSDKIGMRASLIPSGREYILTFDAINFSDPLTFDANITGGNGNLLPQSRSYDSGTTSIANNLAALGVSGTLSFPHTDGVSPNIDIALDGSESAIAILALINGETENTGVEATLSGDPGDQFLVFSTVDHEKELTFRKTINGGDGNFIPQPSEVTTETLKSEVIFQGETSRHATNKVKLPDMTLDLLQPTQKVGDDIQSVTVNLDRGLDFIKDAALNFVDQATETLRLIDIFTAGDDEKFTMTDDEKTKYGEMAGLLRSDQAVETLYRTIESMFTSVIGGQKLPTVGLSLEQGTPKLDLAKFKESFDANSKSIESLFIYSETSTDPSLKSSKHPARIHESLKNADLSVTINKDNDGVYSATIDYPGNAGSPISFQVTEKGSYLTLEPYAGNDADNPIKTIFDGFAFTYDKLLNNGDSATSTVRVTQGVADLGISLLKDMTKENGLFATQIKSYDREIDDKEKEITKIQERGDRDVERMRTRMERVMIQAEQLRSMVNQIHMMEMANYAAAAA